MIRVRLSFVIPVHNAAPYLCALLDSVCQQKEHDIEIICVDDASTDDSAAILAEYAKKDSRLKVLTHPTARGAGAARNTGLDQARGDWLWFVDADDFVPAQAVAQVLSLRTEAEVVIFSADELDDVTGWRTPLPLNLRDLPADDFTPQSQALTLFNRFGNSPWNKIFRRDFVARWGLRFQDVPRANDLAFVTEALARASRLRVLSDCLYVYRINGVGGLQQRNHLEPMAFWLALIEVARRLKAAQVWSLYESSFKRLALEVIIGNLFSFRTRAAFESAASILRAKGDVWQVLDEKAAHAKMRFCQSCYRRVLSGETGGRTFRLVGRLRFSYYNRGLISLLKHICGRLRRK